MKPRWIARAASGAILGLLAAGGIALAQEPAPAGPPGGPPMRRAPGHEGDMRTRMTERRAERLRALHDILAIRTDQEPAWQAYLASMRRERPDGKGGDHAPPRPSATTPERLDAMAARMTERQTRFQAMAAATKTLYAALSPQQQRAFDALPMLGPPAFGHGPGPDGRRGPPE